MKIFVTGPRGMLGSQVCEAVLAAGHKLVRYTGRIENADAQALEGADVLVNCAGIVKQRPDPPEVFARVNAYGPHFLASLCKAVGAQLIHVSSDCVFGLFRGPHDEGDIPTPEDIYSSTKLAGEVAYDGHLTVRTSFVGFGVRGLVHSILAGEHMKASGRFLWNGHTAKTVAGILVRLAEKRVGGILHIPGVEDIDRFALVSALGSCLGVQLMVTRDDSFVRDRRLQSSRWGEFGMPDPPGISWQLEQFALEKDTADLGIDA